MTNKAILPIDWEQKTIERAKNVLSDLRECIGADYHIKWVDDQLASDKSKVPVMVVSFNFSSVRSAGATFIPSCGIRLTTAPSNTIITGDKFVKHVRNSVEHFLIKNGLNINFDM